MSAAAATVAVEWQADGLRALPRSIYAEPELAITAPARDAFRLAGDS